MTVKKWILVFLGALLGAATLLAVCNVVVDPFGVFGDRIFQWYAYDMTQNPRVAKIAYLDQHHGNYNAYVIGSSKASSLSVDALNGYTGDSWYNMTWYGGDLLDERQLVQYLLENYQVERILLTIDPECANLYDEGGQSDLRQAMHGKVCGENGLLFYGRYLFANLGYAWDKLVSWAGRGYLPDEDTVYVPQTGVYDKTLRDSSPIHDLDSYLGYEGMSTTLESASMGYIDQAIADIQAIQALCQEHGVEFDMVGVPVSQVEFAAYPREGVEEFWTRAAQIDDFYAFWGYNSVNGDLRYFYDVQHFRNNAGDMVLATLFGDETVYVPQDFGLHTTPDTVAQAIERAYDQAVPREQLTAQVPILMYHAFTQDPEQVSSTTVLASDFEAQLRALRDAGYTSVSYQQLIDFVTQGTPLPDNPVVITMDDGYTNNLELAAPLLEEYGFTANIAVIGVSVGKDTYKDTGVPIQPHFSLEQALPWVERGVITLTSHSYDMHQVTALDGEDCRQGVLRRDGEGELDYVAALTRDYQRSVEQLEQAVGPVYPVYTYPNGLCSQLSEVVLQELGVAVTVTTESGVNQLLKGVGQSLYQLRRITVEGGLTAGQLLERMEGYLAQIS